MDGNPDNWLAERFEAHRGRLRAVAYRMLGSAGEADDAVQEAWLRLSRTGGDEVENLGGWLTTVVGRVCLDLLRSRRSRREERLDATAPEPVVVRHDDLDDDPEQQALLADSVGLALLVVLDALTPAERLAFVLHDMFSVPFDEIAPIVGRSRGATKMLASRARRRVQEATAPDPDRARQRTVVDAFLAASRGGDFDALLALLDPDAVLRADGAAVQLGATRLVRGAQGVATTFSGRARAVRPALVDGAVGALWTSHGEPRMAFRFTITDGRITAIDMIADPGQLDQLDLATLD